MALYELKNKEISIAIDNHGAELKSLKKLATGTEYMWCGDAKYWGRTSPVLFPFVGGSYNKEFHYEEKSYPMTQHGFARDMDFELESQTENELWFCLKSNEDTLVRFPMEFILHLGYRLEASTVTLLWKVENPGEKNLLFSIGGHPAFNCPIEAGEKQTDYTIYLKGLEEVVSTRINANGMSIDEKDIYPLTDEHLVITENLFDNDALVVEHEQTDTIALCKPDGTPYITVTTDAPLFGIWSPTKKNAPFICIEPWYGRCDKDGFIGDLSEREYVNTIKAGDVFEAHYQITI